MKLINLTYQNFLLYIRFAQPEGFEWRSRASLLVDIPRGAYVLKQLDTGVPGLIQESSFGQLGLNHMPAGEYNTAEIIITGWLTLFCIPSYILVSKKLNKKINLTSKLTPFSHYL